MGVVYLAELISTYGYFILAPAAMFLGPLISLLAGVLLRLEVISIVPTVLALAAGELTADIVWYVLGRQYGELFVHRFGRYVGITTNAVTSAKDFFKKHNDVIIFTSKITAGGGFGIPIMFTAGLSRIPFHRYMMLNIAGQFLWTASLLSIGYFLGHIYLAVSNVLEKISLFALVVLILISLVGFGKYLRRA